MCTGAPPHYSRDKIQMCKNIISKPIEMKENFSKELVSLLKGLLCLKVNANKNNNFRKK